MLIRPLHGKGINWSAFKGFRFFAFNSFGGGELIPAINTLPAHDLINPPRRDPQSLARSGIGGFNSLTDLGNQLDVLPRRLAIRAFDLGELIPFPAWYWFNGETIRPICTPVPLVLEQSPSRIGPMLYPQNGNSLI